MLANTFFDANIYQLFAQCTGQFFFMVDHEGYCHWSTNATEQLALPDAAIQGEHVWQSLVLPEDLPPYLSELREVAAGRPQARGEYRLRTPDGGRIWAQIDLRAAATPDVLLVGTISDLRMHHSIDPVTGLRGSHDFRADLEAATRQSDPWGVILIGLDSFRRINDQHSYSFGDDTLRAVARELQKYLLKNAQLYRLDSDRFGLLCPGVSHSELSQIFSQLQEICVHPLKVQESRIAITFSGAGCLYPEDDLDPENLFRFARIALEAAKTAGGNQFILYSSEMSSQTQRELLLLDKLRESIQHNYEGFSLNYQPLILSQDGSLYGCEVLLRWKNPAFPEGITPYEFVPVLDDSGLMLRVGEWVIQQALRQLSKWIVFKPDFQMSINATSAQFEDPEFRFFVIDCLTREKLSPNLLTLELTESNEIVNTDAVSRAFDFFRSQGIKIAFDDFGMGYASLDIFRVLSADELKIDRSFLERLSYDVTDQKIIEHLISLCHSMNMKVCVEGVESSEVVGIMKQLGPLLLQGYYYNKPMTAEAFEHYYFSSVRLPGLTAPLRLPADVAKDLSRPTLNGGLRPAQPLSHNELVDTIHAGIFQVGLDEQFTFLTCNEGYRRMLGYTSREIQEKFKNKALGVVHPDDLAYVSAEVQRQLGLSDSITAEFRVIRADGSDIWVVATGNVVRSRTGSASLSVVIVDIDQFKRHALAMEQESTQFRTLLANLPAGIKCVRFDQDFTLEYISPAFLQLMGYTAQEIHDQFDDKYISLVYEEDRAPTTADLLEQLTSGDIVTLRYRSRCKDGRLIWIETISRVCPPDADGIQRFYSCVINITDTISEAQKNRAADMASRYQQAAANWGDLLFECNFQTRIVTYSGNYFGVLGRDPQHTFEEELSYVHPEDLPRMIQALENAQNGTPCEGLEVRNLAANGEYVWFSFYLGLPDFVDGVAVTAIGKICSINAEKRERDRLIQQSRTDPLTGLSNRNALELDIGVALEQAAPEQPFCLMLVDINGFKQLNEQMGHPFGDTVLCQMADRLQGLFKEDCLLGRPGRDEFIVFAPLTGVSAQECGEQVLAELCAHYCLGNSCCNVTVSVGIAVSPTDGRSFHELYRCADSALYQAKEIGCAQLRLFSC